MKGPRLLSIGHPGGGRGGPRLLPRPDRELHAGPGLRRGHALLAASALILATPAHALPLDPLGDPDQFHRDIEAINARPLPDGEPLAIAVGQAVLADAKMRGRCEPKRMSLTKPDPVTLDGMITGLIVRGQIENGWIVSVRLDDCPPADPIRVLLLRGADGQKLQAFFAGQGESLVWPSLGREVLTATVAAVSQRLSREDPACKPAQLTPTGARITGRSPDLGPSRYGIRLKGSWNEAWTFEPCGHRVSVPIAFRTNGTGGAYWDIGTDGIVFTR